MSGYSEHDQKMQERAVKKALIAELRKTALGRHMLDFLKKEGFSICVSGELTKKDADGSSTAAFVDFKNKKMVLSPHHGMSELLHFFAHETRHVAQWVLSRGLNGAEMLHPYNLLLRMRLMEMDADAFAVHFMLDHVGKVKRERAEENTHFENLMKRNNTAYDRSGFYRAVAERWQEGERDPARMMITAANEFLRHRALIECYGQWAQSQWQDNVSPVLRKHYDKPESDFFRDFASAARGFKDGTYTKPAEHVKKAALLFSRIFNEAGSPDYMAGLDMDRAVEAIINEAAGADKAVSGRTSEAVMEEFIRIRDAYIEKDAQLAASAQAGGGKRHAARKNQDAAPVPSAA